MGSLNPGSGKTDIFCTTSLFPRQNKVISQMLSQKLRWGLGWGVPVRGFYQRVGSAGLGSPPSFSGLWDPDWGFHKPYFNDGEVDAWMDHTVAR